MPLAWIALNSIKGLGPVRIKRLLDRFGSAEEVFKRGPAELRNDGSIPGESLKELSDPKVFAEAERQLREATRQKVDVLTLARSDYPPYLREIFAPPPVLFVKGKLSAFSGHAIGIVGTRHPTPYGRDVTKTLARELVGNGLTIVSGLALGIDTVAHQTCIDAGGVTIAVLGCGIDCLYPKSNEALAGKIAETGALVSEFPLGTPPESFNFPRRNRIISGLSAGVVVVEGGERSGGLITAHYALQQGREVFAVPGPITSAMSAGPFNLIKQGATPARSGREIAETLSFIKSPLLKAPVRSDPSPVISVPETLLSENERRVFDRLGAAPLRLDEIADLTGMSVPELFDLLLNLELKGAARQQSGQCYTRASCS